MKKETKSERPTINEMRKKMTDLGEKVLTVWEDEQQVYCASVRSLGPVTYGHPAVEIQWLSGWYSEKTN